MLLVPGVAALKALYIVQTQGIVQGISATYEVIVLIAAILGGLLLGSAVLSVGQAVIPRVTDRLSGRKS